MSKPDIPLMKNQHAYCGEKSMMIEENREFNKCAYACGRCQICHGSLYFNEKSCCMVLCNSCRKCNCGICRQYPLYWVTGTTSISSMIAGLVWDLVLGPPICDLVRCSPLIAGGGLLTTCVCNILCGKAVYHCAGCMGKQYFIADFERGMKCYPDDFCSLPYIREDCARC